ncbi:unnamed protein product [Pedinophyceae sp. YPF-701]|nr:unnamed protein product [Pedinophyceae sp. YPF-701]
MLRPKCRVPAALCQRAVRAPRAPSVVSAPARRACCMAAAREKDSFNYGMLQPWQVRQLKKAFFAGKRNVSIKRLSGDLGLHRDDVISWLKDYGELPEAVHASDKHALEAEEQAVKERKAILAETRRQKQVEHEKDAGKKTFFELRDEGLIGRKRINPTIERTLETVYEKTSRPSDEILRSLWDLHKVPRQDVIAWFEARREADGRRRRRRARPAPDSTQWGDQDRRGRR